MNRMTAPPLKALRLPALCFSALLVGSVASAYPVPNDGLVRIGQTARLDGASVRPLKVIEDSRCPANARCIWAGRLVVRADVRSGGYHRQVDLTLGEPRLVGRGTLTLESATPAGLTNRPLRPRDYRVGFAFTR